MDIFHLKLNSFFIFFFCCSNLLAPGFIELDPAVRRGWPVDRSVVVRSSDFIRFLRQSDEIMNAIGSSELERGMLTEDDLWIKKIISKAKCDISKLIDNPKLANSEVIQQIRIKFNYLNRLTSRDEGAWSIIRQLTES